MSAIQHQSKHKTPISQSERVICFRNILKQDNHDRKNVGTKTIHQLICIAHHVFTFENEC